MLELLPLLSQALLWPVIILLFLGIAATLTMLGGLCGEFLQRRKWRQANATLVQNLMQDTQRQVPLAELEQALRWRRVQATFSSPNPDLDKILDDYQLRVQKDLSRPNMLVRLGPMLGLAGTLIPLGPGLTALSSGDVNTLSSQLVIAFTSTVLGLFVGGLSYVIHSVQRNWYAQDLGDLEFLFQRRGA